MNRRDDCVIFASGIDEKPTTEYEALANGSWLVHDDFLRDARITTENDRENLANEPSGKNRS